MAQPAEQSDTSSDTQSVRSGHTSDYVKLAKEGIRLLLTNDWQGALSFFTEHKHDSILMSAGYSFVECLLAFLSFEEEQKEQALRALNETTEMCKSGSAKSRKASRRKKMKEMSEYEESVRREIVITDCLLFQAGLNILNQDVKSYIKGGWCIRQAWKRYRKLYEEVREMHCKVTGKKLDHMPTVEREPSKGRVKKVVSDNHLVGHTAEGTAYGPEISKELSADDLKGLSEDSESVPDFAVFRSGFSDMSVEDMDRLLGAVSFGYGVFRLFITLIPPKIAWWIQLLGFEGNQDEGLTLLEFASQSNDVKSPIATLALVWYHSTIRPFFSLDGANLAAGVDDASRILEKALKEYPESALLLYFRCRIFRLQANAEASMEACKLAYKLSANQRETRQICLYELGRMSVMQMKFTDAFDCFIKLKEESRWSKCFCAYLSALCCGATGDLDKAMGLLREVPTLIFMKDNRLEIFVKRRAEQAITLHFDQNQFTILAMEILYIWTSFPGCTQSELLTLSKACKADEKQTLRHLRCLIDGVINYHLKNSEMAEKCFLEAVDIYENGGLQDDMHIAAFAYFELGLMKIQSVQQSADLQEPKRYLTHIKHHYKNYDFEFRLHVKVDAALKRISEAEKAFGESSGKSCVVQ